MVGNYVLPPLQFHVLAEGESRTHVPRLGIEHPFVFATAPHVLHPNTTKNSTRHILKLSPTLAKTRF